MLERAHRSSRRFERNLGRAITTHQKKLDDGHFSLPPHEGVLAIVPSRGATTNSEYSSREQIRIFQEEAEYVAASKFAEQYADTEITPAATSLEVGLALSNPEVAGIVLIGHGTISAFRLHQDEHVNWQYAAKMTRRLKLGHFVQRMCGAFRLHDSLPMGTFAVADQRDVIAALGLAIDDKHPDESLFRPVYDRPINTAEDILALRDLYWQDEGAPH